jgi:hypothetical protein
VVVRKAQRKEDIDLIEENKIKTRTNKWRIIRKERDRETNEREGKLKECIMGTRNERKDAKKGNNREDGKIFKT